MQRDSSGSCATCTGVKTSLERFSTPIRMLKHSPGFPSDTPPAESAGASSGAVQGACPSEGEWEASGSGGAGRQCGGCRAPPSEDWLAARPRKPRRLARPGPAASTIYYGTGTGTPSLRRLHECSPPCSRGQEF